MMNPKSGLLSLMVALVFSTTTFAQENSTDQANPIASSDTTINEEGKENILDNIPIVSLDESDGQDGSAQNISGQINAG